MDISHLYRGIYLAHIVNSNKTVKIIF
jgi:hypothetical protein